MRKATLHILFLCLLLTTGKALALVSSHNVPRVAIQKMDKQNVLQKQLESDTPTYKNDLFIAVDDADESEFDSHTNSVKEKQLNTIPFFTAAKLLLAKTAGTDCNDCHYVIHNFSRLPRFTYISLRVLRL